MEQTLLGLKPGSIIQDSYRITRVLGQGGMGATFAGQNIATGHDVAIKVITPDFARNHQAAELFRREANLLRTVRSDAVVQYETSMMDKSGQIYLIMEYISGQPLSHYLDRGARLASEDVMKLGARVADGLAAIHALGIVHRDISPDNIIVPDDDVTGAKLIDFGVASDTVGTEKSIIGDSFAGKISYASPEQLGLHDNRVTTASDSYALGLVLMKTAGLDVPGAGGSLAQAIDARRSDISITDDRLSPDLVRVLEALLKTRPGDRPTDLRQHFTKPAVLPPRPKDAPRDADGSAGGQNAKGNALDEALVSALPKAHDGDVQTRKTWPVFVGVVVLALVAGGVWYILAPPGGGGTGQALREAEGAREALAAPDPLTEISAMMATGESEELSAAFGALMTFARDETNETADRGRAALMIARMYDPETHSSATSPFPAPNPTAARRFYAEAADLGNADAEAPLARLSN